jgi:hypothetical protein
LSDFAAGAALSFEGGALRSVVCFFVTASSVLRDGWTRVRLLLDG